MESDRASIKMLLEKTLVVFVSIWGVGGIMTYREIRSHFPDKTMVEALVKATIWPIVAVLFLLIEREREMVITTEQIEEAIEDYYASATQIPNIAILVINERRKIVSLNLAGVELFGLEGEDVVIKQRLDVFLPDYMKGKAHDDMIDGAFANFKLAIEKKSTDLAMRAMSSRADGEPREVDAFTFGPNKRPLKIKIKLAPLPVEGILHIAAFIQNSSAQTPFGDEVKQGSEVVITNARLQIVSEAGNIVGKQFTGIFGFWVNQVFGTSRAGRIASAAASLFTIGSFVYAALWAFDSKFGTKPTIFNLPIPASNSEPSSPSKTLPRNN